jgi:ubiquinone/menaquinone biosynthesis C-methylase UbiE
MNDEQNILNIELLEASATNIPLNDSSVDGVIASLVLHAIKPLSDGLTEIKRVMKDGAYLLCFEIFSVRDLTTHSIYQS